MAITEPLTVKVMKATMMTTMMKTTIIVTMMKTTAMITMLFIAIGISKSSNDEAVVVCGLTFLYQSKVSPW